MMMMVRRPPCGAALRPKGTGTMERGCDGATMKDGVGREGTAVPARSIPMMVMVSWTCTERPSLYV